MLEPPGTYTTLYEPSWILLDVPCPHYLKCIAALAAPPFIQYIHMLCGPLGCVGMRWHPPYHWILLEHLGTTWNLYDPIRTVLDSPRCALPPVPEMHSCTDVQLPPLSYNTFTCSGGLWGVLACVGILHTIGYYWNILEPPGTYTTLYEPSWILLGVPCPQYLKCIAALMCSYPRFHTIHQALMRIADRFEQRGRFNVQIFLVASKLLFIFASKIKRNKLQRSSKHRGKNAQPSCFQSFEIS